MAFRMNLTGTYSFRLELWGFWGRIEGFTRNKMFFISVDARKYIRQIMLP